MVGVMVLGVIAKFALSEDVLIPKSIIYWVEAIALAVFGIAWIVAGKTLGIFVDEDHKHHLFGIH